MDFRVVAYYTRGTLYEEHVRNLIRSMENFRLDFKVEGVPNLGDWYRNTQYKPTFLREQLSQTDKNIVYVDADAVFCKHPSLFQELCGRPDVHVGVCELDHKNYRRKHVPPEILSGTVYFQNSGESRDIIDRWIIECKKDPLIWDQAALGKVVRETGFFDLPDSYCMIYDYMASVQDPVIKHFQASRSIRNKGSVSSNGSVQYVKSVQKPKPQPRRVEKGTVMVRRLNRR